MIARKLLAFLFFPIIGVSSFANDAAPPAVVRLPDIKVIGFKKVDTQQTESDCEPKAPTEKSVLACEPDPYEKVCADVPIFFEEQFRKIDAKALDFEEKWYADFQKANKDLYDKYKKEARGSQLQTRILDGISSKFSRGYVEKDKVENFRRTFKEGTGYFRKMLEDAAGIPKEEKEILLKQIASCEKNVYLNLQFTNDPSHKSVLPNQIGAEFRYELDIEKVRSQRESIGTKYTKGQRLTPITDSSTCTVVGHNKFVDYCQTLSTECLYVIAHELGHRIDSCSFITTFYDYQLNDLHKVERHHDEYDTDRLNTAIVHQRSARSLANFMIAQSECMGSLSAPKDAIPNSCEKNPNGKFLPSLEDEKRCSFNEVKGHPSQWREAEADFWAASTIATYLKSRKLSEAATRTEALRPLWFWCMESKIRKERLDARVSGRNWTVRIDYDESPKEKKDRDQKDGDPKKACETQPRDSKQRAIAAWDVPHQNWALRFNRNVLRNSDLRDVLNCPSTEQVPVTCSPTTGITRTFLIR